MAKKYLITLNDEYVKELQESVKIANNFTDELNLYKVTETSMARALLEWALKEWKK